MNTMLSLLEWIFICVVLFFQLSTWLHSEWSLRSAHFENEYRSFYHSIACSNSPFRTFRLLQEHSTSTMGITNILSLSLFINCPDRSHSICSSLWCSTIIWRRKRWWMACLNATISLCHRSTWVEWNGVIVFKRLRIRSSISVIYLWLCRMNKRLGKDFCRSESRGMINSVCSSERIESDKSMKLPSTNTRAVKSVDLSNHEVKTKTNDPIPRRSSTSNTKNAGNHLKVN